jgi:hypothetical protein
MKELARPLLFKHRLSRQASKEEPEIAKALDRSG